MKIRSLKQSITLDSLVDKHSVPTLENAWIEHLIQAFFPVVEMKPLALLELLSYESLQVLLREARSAGFFTLAASQIYNRAIQALAKAGRNQYTLTEGYKKDG